MILLANRANHCEVDLNLFKIEAFVAQVIRFSYAVVLDLLATMRSSSRQPIIGAGSKR